MSVELLVPRYGDVVEIDFSPERVAQDKCGVVAIIADPSVPVGHYVGESITSLQHRGRHGAGAFVSDGTEFHGRAAAGLVQEVFPDGTDYLDDTIPNAFIALGQDRWATQGKISDDTAQPFERGRFAFAHNGNVDNAAFVAIQYGFSAAECVSDSISIALVLEKRTRELGSLERAVAEVVPQLEGAYSFVISDAKKIIAVRDPSAIRPLSIGRLLGDKGYIVSSETITFDKIGARYIRDVEKGEVVVLTQHTEQSFYLPKEMPQQTCGLEPAYFMDPRSRVANGRIPARDVRTLLGRQMAHEALAGGWRPDPATHRVFGVPESGIPSAQSFADRMGVPYVTIATKKEGAGRSFLEASAKRQAEVAAGKLLLRPSLIVGRKLIGGDDSVVRGNQFGELTKSLRELGAKEVHLVAAFPLMVRACHLGVATSTQEELLAYRHQTNREMAAFVGVNSLRAISAPGFRRVVESVIGGICLGCVDGNFPVAPRGGSEDQQLALASISV